MSKSWSLVKDGVIVDLIECENCHVFRIDVKEIVDPYQKDIDGVDSIMKLCSECLTEMSEDV